MSETGAGRTEETGGATSRGPEVKGRKGDDGPEACRDPCAFIADAMSEMLSYFTADLQVIWMNKAAAASVGKAPEDLVGLTCHEIWQHRETPCPACPILRARDTLQVQEGEIRTYGGRLWYVRGYPILDKGGELLGIAQFAQDITEKKAVEMRLREALERSGRELALIGALAGSHALIAGDIPALAGEVAEKAVDLLGVERVGVWLFEAGDKELRCSALYERTPHRHSKGHRLFEKDYQKEFQALRTEKYIAADDPLTDPRTIGYAEGYLTPLKITSMLMAVIRASGRTLGGLYFEHVATPHHWETDEITVACHLADILAIAILNREKRLAEEGRRAAEKDWETFFQAIGHPTLILDPGHRILHANKACLALTGKKEEEIEGTYCWEVFHGKETLSHTGGCPLERMKQSGSVETLEMEMEAFGRRFLVSCTPVCDREGRLDRVIHMATDIEEHRRGEEERLEMERQLFHAQKLESLGVMAGGIAHDFNNLLLAISGNLEMAIMELPTSSGTRGKIEKSLRAAKRATDLTRQMLAYSGKGQSHLKKLSLSELVEDNLLLCKAAAPRKVNIDIHLPRDLPMIEGDPGQIQQVAMNLITNAIEAIGEHPGQVTLEAGTVTCTQEDLRGSLVKEIPQPGRFVYFLVRDTGCGMDKRVLRRLFDPFFTTKFMGRGLGLSAVQGIVKGHRGAIFIQSEPGVGTEVRVLFPPADAHSPAVIYDESFLRSPPGTQDLGGPMQGTVLIVDDEAMIRNLCLEMVGIFGLRALVASDGEEALRIFREQGETISCVILDQTMPRMDGVAVFYELLRLKPDIKVILSSGYNEQDLIQQLLRQGLAGFIQKPYQIHSLQEMLRGVLGVPQASP